MCHVLIQKICFQGGEDVSSGGGGMDGSGGPSNPTEEEKVSVDQDLAPSPTPMDNNAAMVEVSIML